MARTLDDLHARLERLETLLRTAGLLPAPPAAHPAPAPPPATRQDRLIAQSAANPLLALRTDIPSATTPEQSEPAPGAEPERMLGAGLPTPPAPPTPPRQPGAPFSPAPPPPAPLRAERGAGPEPTLDASSGSPLSDGP